MKDYYEILGVAKNASAEDIKKKYRSLALKMHPDRLVKKSDLEKKEIEKRFQEITNAYETLSNEKTRRQYDNESRGGFTSGFGGGFEGFSSAGDESSVFQEIFENFFQSGRRASSTTRANTPRRGEDILISVVLPFRKAVNGTEITREIDFLYACPACKQTGAYSKDHIKTCSTCNGSGSVENIQRSFYGSIRTSTVCSTCKGSGKIISKKCDLCRGKNFVTRSRTVDIKIPRGLQVGQRLRIPSGGNDGLYSSEKGDIFIEFEIEENSYFKKKNNDIHVQLPISFLDAIVGNTVKVVTIEGVEELKVPRGSQFGDCVVLRNKGFYTGVSRENRGDFYVWLKIMLPRKISSESENTLRDLQEKSP